MQRLPTPEPLRGRTGKLTWRVRSTDPRTGIRICRTFPTHDLANAYVASIVGATDPRPAELTPHTIQPTPEAVKNLQKGRSFKELVDKYVEVRIPELKNTKDQATQTGRIRKHLTPYFGDADLIDITSDEIATYSAKLKTDKKMKVSTALRFKILTLLGSILRYAEESEWIIKLPKIRKPKVQTKSISYIHKQEEIRQLLLIASHWTGRGWDDTGKATGPRVMFGKMLETLYATAVYAGLRKGELAGLLWKHINMAPTSHGRVITVTNSYQGTTKPDKIRHVLIGNSLFPLLKRWHDLKGSPTDGYVFTSERGTALIETSSVFKKTFHEALEKARIPRLRFHDLRHTFASHWVINGGDIFRLQQLMGHSDVKVTMRYAHLAPNHFKQDWARM